MEFLLGGIAASGACLATNPLDVVKTRLQLQGEEVKKGHSRVYRNSLHALYVVAKVDGVQALQKGLVPALYYQFCMNGIRLGTFAYLQNHNLTQNADSTPSLPRTIAGGAFAGCLGAFLASPFYLVKTHLQSRSHITQAAVGTQHRHADLSLGHALRYIYKRQGVLGLWRGSSSALPRVAVGSSTQLSTFVIAKRNIQKQTGLPEEGVALSFCASMVSGIGVAALMTPFDVVSTRMYNQGVDAQGRGLLYTNPVSCFAVTLRQEGLRGLYQGWGANYLRVGPHTVLSLVIWTQLREYYKKL